MLTRQYTRRDLACCNEPLVHGCAQCPLWILCAFHIGPSCRDTHDHYALRDRSPLGRLYCHELGDMRVTGDQAYPTTADY